MLTRLDRNCIEWVTHYKWGKLLYYTYLNFKYSRKRKRFFNSIKKENKCRIAFIISSLPMWRLQGLIEILASDNRFEYKIILYPFQTFSKENQETSMEELELFFKKKGIVYSNQNSLLCSSLEAWESYNPEIVFYQQLYPRLYLNHLDVEKNLSRVLCYLPYGLITFKGDWIYNNLFTNTFWRLYYATNMHKQYARKHSFNCARNVVVVGEPNARKYLYTNHRDVWKKQLTRKKRIIWAPHFSINEGGFLHRASFVWSYELMQRIAEDYSSTVQFCFKPHPRLRSELYNHPDWGVKRTNDYYSWWSEKDNTQIATGEYIDLFMTSDALIHDCGSFTAEYLYTRNPLLFLSKDFSTVYQDLDDFGSSCMDLHYHGGEEIEIREFINCVILLGNDILKAKRDLFFSSVLLDSHLVSTERKVYQDLVSSIFR